MLAVSRNPRALERKPGVGEGEEFGFVVINGTLSFCGEKCRS